VAAAPAPDALRTIARECLQQIAANAAGLLADDDPEWVHQMRIGTRRLRSCLALAVRYLPPAAVDPLLLELKWLASTLGVARDWDVLATETLPAFAAQATADPARIPEVRRLRARVAARRSAARAAARVAVRSPRFQHLVLAVGRLCSAPAPASATAAGGRTDGDPPSVRRFSGKLLERRHHRLRKRAEACAPGTPEARHALRIAAKKLRYAAEFFAPLPLADREREYIHALAGLQDVLGRGNDAVTAARLVTQVARGDDDPTAAALRDWVEARGVATVPLLAPAWARFAAARRFWNDD
jgi:CHAD domain-containing protein